MPLDAGQFESDAEFDNERWYEILKSVTFPSVFEPLSQAEARAMIKEYRCRYCGDVEPGIDERRALLALMDRLDGMFAAVGGSAFVRLSSRSPKDAITLQPSTFIEAAPPDESANDRLSRFFRESGATLRVTEGLEGLNLLLSSERIFVDLLKSLEHKEQVGWQVQICAREWAPGLDDTFEFRGFVADGDLVALSQYNHMIYVGRLHQEQPRLQQMISDFYQHSVQPLLRNGGIRDCIVDFAVIGERCWVIELNPANVRTGPGLFSWENDQVRLLPSRSLYNPSPLPLPLLNHVKSSSHERNMYRSYSQGRRETLSFGLWRSPTRKTRRLTRKGVACGCRSPSSRQAP